MNEPLNIQITEAEILADLLYPATPSAGGEEALEQGHHRGPGEGHRGLEQTLDHEPVEHSEQLRSVRSGVGASGDRQQLGRQRNVPPVHLVER
jgi:hypothetical protein